MANARLHVICGNCGCNDSFSWRIVEDLEDYGEYQEDGVILQCNNCVTNHNLNDTMPRCNTQRRNRHE